MEYKIGQQDPWYKRRWWLRVRTIEERIDEINHLWHACAELYVPWWAWPLELLHRMIFGKIVLEKIDE